MEKLFPLERSYIDPLSDILGISTRSVNRKLLGISPFSAEEISKICEVLDVSISDIITQDSDITSFPVELQDEFFSNPIQYRQRLKSFMELLKLALKNPPCTLGLTCNTFPSLIGGYYQYMSKFAYLRWLYFNKGEGHVIPMDAIKYLDFDEIYTMEYSDMLSQVSCSQWIVYINYISNYLAQVRFFYKHKYVEKKHIQAILDELKDHLNIAYKNLAKGSASEEHRVDLYYSELPLHNDVYLLESNSLYLGMIHTHYFSTMMLKNRETFKLMKSWFDMSIISSTPISYSGEAQRLFFFQKQWDAIKSFEKETGC